VFKLTLPTEGKTLAKLRVNTIEKEFNIIEVDSEIAGGGDEISHRLKIPMADALIMATAKRLQLPCVTDDPHFTEVKRIGFKSKILSGTLVFQMVLAYSISSLPIPLC